MREGVYHEVYEVYMGECIMNYMWGERRGPEAYAGPCQTSMTKLSR